VRRAQRGALPQRRQRALPRRESPRRGFAHFTRPPDASLCRASCERALAPRTVTSANANTFGTAFRVTTFGESHGGGVGCVVDGVPPRLQLSNAELQARAAPPSLPRAAARVTCRCSAGAPRGECLCPVARGQRNPRTPLRAVTHAAAARLPPPQFELDRRRPGQSRITTPRNEEDTCEILSGAPPRAHARAHTAVRSATP
jgi:hypothetical protein